MSHVLSFVPVWAPSLLPRRDLRPGPAGPGAATQPAGH